MADLIGQHLGQYEIIAELGAGGMATVYRARQPSMGRDVAVKVIESKLARNPEFVKRFARETRTIATLSHAPILKVAEAYAKWRGARLPTEAEWEYAARGPQSPIYPWGDILDSRKANIHESSPGGTMPVGSYANGRSWIGAYDMIGNASEWVADWYSDNYYQQQVKDDPVGPDSGSYRVLRGGSWGNYLNIARAAFRVGVNPGDRGTSIGFRIVFMPPPPPTPTPRS